MVGLMIAGANRDGSPWVTARGWASLDDAELLLPDHRFPAYAITKLITSTAVLRLVAEGHVRLDEPANTYLRTIRLADDAVTVRELLSHTGGVDSAPSMFADRAPELVSVTGPVAACGGPRGTFAYGNGGHALLGQLIADVSGSRYEDASTWMVLDPLGMSASWFPRDRPATRAITGHQLTDEGVFEPAPTRIAVVPAGAGLWTTAADLVRFGRGWSSLLPDALAREALAPQAEREGAPGGQMGLGWWLNLPKDLAGHHGAGPGSYASLNVRPSTGQTWVVVTNQLVSVEPVNDRLIRPIA
jgi:CubicO group peptidase (beta-lactamase class C family)